MVLRTDLAIDNDKKYKKIKQYKNVDILESIINNNVYHTIKYNYIDNNIKKILINELLYFMNLSNYKSNHILFVGLGNESNTADSLGPKTIKKIKVNFNINNIQNKSKVKVSALIPGVLGITGIETNKIIKSVIKEIKPNLIVLIDSLITNNIDFINKSIEISNKCLSPGSGIYGNNKTIKTKIPIISIGIPTSLEYIHNNLPFLLTPSNIDDYINKISNIISDSLNELIYKVLIDIPV